MPFTPVTAVVESAEHLSPNFLRVVFTGSELARVGSDAPAYDQRIKLIFPGPSGRLPQVADPANFYPSWLELPDDERGHMRTYSIRWWELAPGSTRLAVDFVLHLVPGETGPAATWAAAAQPGDEVLLIAPLRDEEPMGGIEFRPGAATDIVLVGDETAAPAIARILEDLRVAGSDVTGTAYIEVPEAADALPIDGPAGVEVRYFIRGEREFGAQLCEAVLGDADAELVVDTTPELVWETPVFSGSGEEIGEEAAEIPRYYWIAGESGLVTGLRRSLTRDKAVARSQVAFMGYWKRGVAMRA
ncbi:siderophore-interacting protein [Corynebacterium doosanense]|uniref:Siderophore-interacting protein n=1 Tax=Corynebacterium doosanense CAU 212 = DSM 45436 TaxID=558173 RepID=A0A097ICS6_9CORY|nr:siderophore-interacting protein [Corynebacterium doosanense]AIT59913.1 siderophore-interacting protein [Corynebacterium doosanense CAU 212 = DSM 45436]